MSDRIIITYDNEDHELILFDGEPVKQNKKNYTPGDPGAIKNEITQTFSIPEKENKSNLSFLGQKGSSNDILSKSVKAKHINGSQTIMHDADFLAYKKNNSYDVLLKGGNALFFGQISEGTLNDLDLSDLEEVWTLTNIIANNTNTENFIYGLIDWGVLSEHPTYFEANELFPLIFVKTLFDRIFSSIYNTILTESWTYAGDIFSSTDFTKKVIPVDKQLANDNLKSNCEVEARKLSSQTIQVGDTEQGLLFDNEISDTYNLLSTFTPTGGYANNTTRYTIPSSGFYSFEIVISYDLSSSGTPNSNLTLFQNAATSYQTVNLVVAGTSLTHTFTVTNQEFTKGTYFWVGGDVPVTDILLINVSSGVDISYFKCTLANFEFTEFGIGYPLEGNLPEMKQIDLIKEIMQMFSLIAVPDNDSRTITFRKFEEIGDNHKNMEVDDFTDKLDESFGIDNDFSFRNLSKSNWFRWSKDEKDNLPENAGESSFYLSGFNYIGESDFLKSLFAYSLTSIYGGSEIVPKIKMFEVEDGGGIVRKNEFKPRIYDLNSQSGSVQYSDGLSTTTQTTDLPFLDLIDWTNLQTTYWPTYILILNDPDTPTMYFFLSVEDFVNFDFFKPKFVKGWGDYVAYDISGFVKKRSAPIKLIRL